MHECKGGLKRARARVGDRVVITFVVFGCRTKQSLPLLHFIPWMISILTKCFIAYNYMFSFIFHIHCSIQPLG